MLSMLKIQKFQSTQRGNFFIKYPYAFTIRIQCTTLWLIPGRNPVPFILPNSPEICVYMSVWLGAPWSFLVISQERKVIGLQDGTLSGKTNVRYSLTAILSVKVMKGISESDSLHPFWCLDCLTPQNKHVFMADDLDATDFIATLCRNQVVVKLDVKSLTHFSLQKIPLRHLTIL